MTCDSGNPDGDILYLEANNTVTVINPPLTLGFDNISNANLLVGDASNFNDWNTFFDLPTNGTPFTSVTIVGNNVNLRGGIGGIFVAAGLFFANTSLISLIDEDTFLYELGLDSFGACTNLVTFIANSVEIIGPAAFEDSTSLLTLSFNSLITIGSFGFNGCLFSSFSSTTVTTITGTSAFSQCSNLQSIILPACASIGSDTFSDSALTTIDLSSCTSLGENVLDNFVFFGITGNTITLTVPPELMTCNAANPDGDIQYLQANNTVTIVNPPLLTLGFDNISNADLLVGDASDVSDWNTFFDLPTNGTPFASVTIVGNDVKLTGGSNIHIKDYLFVSNSSLISVVDNKSIVSAGDGCFYGCTSATTFDLPVLETVGYGCFYGCTSVTSFDFPLLETAADGYCFYGCTLVTTFDFPALKTAGEGCFAACELVTTFDLPVLEIAGNYCFQVCTSATTFNLPSCTNLGSTVGNDGVFLDNIGNTITLTVPVALMTCDSGNPDGDIQYLQANNTVTVITI
jgi:hypothetical protein